MSRLHALLRAAAPRGRHGAQAHLRSWIGAGLLIVAMATTASAQAPVITTQPTEQTECAGGSVTFTVVATGATSYQWRFNGGDISGATSDTLTLTNLMLSDAGAYRVNVTNGSGSTLSDPGALSVLGAPTIISQPTAQTTCPGASVTFNVTASGAGLNYTWTRNGSSVGTDSPALTLPSVTAGDAGSYQVIVTGSCGLVTSDIVALDVLDPTLIVAEPTSASVCPGGSATFAIVASGEGALTYAWTHNGTPVGTDSPILSVTGASAADAGNYQATVTGGCGAASSVVVTLTILDPPAIVTAPLAQAACPGDTVNFSVTATGSGLSYAWTRDGTAVGTDSPTLSLASVGAGDVGTYGVEITGTCGTVSPTGVGLTLGNPTTIVTSPTPQIGCSGDSVMFSVSATGDSLNYAWTRDGTPVGSNLPTLTVASIGAGDAGSYVVTVTGDCGTVASSGVALTVGNPTAIVTPPSALSACAGDLASFTVTATGDNLSYAWTRDGSPVGSDSPTLTIASVVLADAGAYVVAVTGDCGTVNSVGVDLSVANPTVIVAGPASQTGCPGDPATFSVSATGDSLSYAWTRDGTPVGTDSPTLTLPSVGAGDAGSYVVTVTGDCGAVASSAVTLTVGNPTAIVTPPSAQSGCTGDMVAFTVTATGDNLSYAWTRDGSPAGTDSPTLTIASIGLADAGSYVVTVTGDCGTVNSVGVDLTVGNATVIVTGPASQIACSGDLVTFSVSATGDSLSYAWTRDGTPVGTDSPTLTLPSVGAGDAGTYTVTLTGDCGAVTSSGADLTVGTPTTIATPPTAQSGCPGDLVSFSVSATGNSLSYAWTRDGSPIGGDSPTLTIASIGLADAGSYVVTVTGDCGTETSVGVSLTIGNATTILVQPTPQSGCPGDPVNFSVFATGDSLSYAWTRDGTPVGSDSPTLTIASLGAGDAGSYTVAITGDCGTVTSSDAALTVASATAISTPPASQSGCTGNAAVFTVTATGDSLSYAWTRDGTPVGIDSATLTLTGLGAGDAGNYTVTVTGTCGAVTSAAATLTILDPVTITADPSSVSACPDDTVTFTSAATGTDVTYQWTRDGVPVGSGEANLELVGVTAADAGFYRVTVSNSCGDVLSSPASLTVFEATAITDSPTSASLCTGAAITLTVAATGTGTLSYSWIRNGSPVGTDSPELVIASASTSDAGDYQVQVTGDCGSVASGIATLEVLTPPTILSGPLDQIVVEDSSVLFAVSAFGSNLEYQWSFEGTEIPGATASTYNIAVVALTDAGVYSVVIQNECGMFSESANLIVQPLVPPPVQNIQCCFSDQSSQVCWNAGIVYDSIEIVRNGSLVATIAGDEVCYLDPILPAATYVYEVTGIIGAMIGDTVTCTTSSILSPTDLACEVFDESPFAYSAMLNWVNGEAYDSIQIDRDGGLVAVLPGTDTTFTEVGLILGQHDYAIRGVVDAAGTGCSSVAESTCSVPNSGSEIFRRGDSNNDGLINVADVIFVISWLFTDGPDPSCFDAADANDDGIANIADAIFLISYNFLDGIDPPPPFPEPGTDPTTDSLGCEDSIAAP